MSRGINKVILIGNLGADPEMRYTQNSTAIANLSIATSESWKDKTSGEQREQTEWHRVVMYRRLAEIAGEYLKKGSKVYIEGKLNTRKWQGQDGQDRYTTEVVANEMQMLDGRDISHQGGYNQQRSTPQAQAAPQQQGGYGQQQATYTGGRNAQQQDPHQFRPQPNQAHDMPDDDIPFAPIGLQHRTLLNCI